MDESTLRTPTTTVPFTETALRALVMGVLERAGPMESKTWVCDELVKVMTSSDTSA